MNCRSSHSIIFSAYDLEKANRGAVAPAPLVLIAFPTARKSVWSGNELEPVMKRGAKCGSLSCWAWSRWPSSRRKPALLWQVTVMGHYYQRKPVHFFLYGNLLRGKSCWDIRLVKPTSNSRYG